MRRHPGRWTEPFRAFAAWAGGYFWLDCPRCGRMFAGYEVGKGDVPTSEPGINRVTCKWCPDTQEGDYHLWTETGWVIMSRDGVPRG